MTAQPGHRSAPDTLAAEALHILERGARSPRSSSWTTDRRVLGVVHLHDLWRTEMF